MRNTIYYKIFSDAFGIALAVFCAAVGLESFLIPNGFLDGGVTGMSMLLSEVTKIPLSVFIIVINLPFIAIGFRTLNKVSIIKSVLTISLLSLCLFIFKYPTITDDKILSAVFGGALLGAGIGFAVRSGSVLDGTEIASLILSKKMGLTVGSIIFIFNVFLFSVDGIVLGIERAMYSILTYVVASKSIDFILNGIEEYTAVTIISSESEKIKKFIMKEFAIGMTIYKGKRGLAMTDQDILFCVVTRFEVPKIIKISKELDSKAFVITHLIDNTFGGLIKARKERF